MRVLIGGDSHGSYRFFEMLCERAQRLDCSEIIQVGDFGYVWREKKEVTNAERLAALDGYLRRAGLTLRWLDGNHEHFENMREQYGATPDSPSVVQMTDYIAYMPRGYRFNLDDVSCMAFGGAVSIDVDMRVKFVDWFPAELITDEQVARVPEEHVDILFSHDCPLGGPVLDQFLMPGNWGLSETIEKRSRDNRIRMREVFNKITPRLVVHGHYHKRYNDRINDATIIGLDCNFNAGDAYTVIDTDDPIFRHQVLGR